jgi:hypothetical protein
MAEQTQFLLGFWRNRWKPECPALVAVIVFDRRLTEKSAVKLL